MTVEEPTGAIGRREDEADEADRGDGRTRAGIGAEQASIDHGRAVRLAELRARIAAGQYEPDRSAVARNLLRGVAAIAAGC